MEIKKNGAVPIDFLSLILTICIAVLGGISYMYANFVTHKELDSLGNRLERIESKIDLIQSREH